MFTFPGRMRHRQTPQQHCRPAAPIFERLEERLPLDGTGFLSGSDVHLTLSFAEDGTVIAGQPNQLTSLFDEIAPPEQWQSAILSAFQTWARETNADIGVVNDGGEPFGAAGPSQHDPRFGDIRVGAIAMAPNVGAVSVPVDNLVSGTWFADVLFNTEYDFQSLDDILAIAMHEAGNVFGLEDNNDPLSPLSPGDPPTVRAPTTADIANLQQMYGTRAADVNEVAESGGDPASDNDSFANATPLEANEIAEGAEKGSAPTLVYGDITTNTDVDYFLIETPGGYQGDVTFELRTAGISLLDARLRVFNGNQSLIDEAIVENPMGGTAVVPLSTVNGGDEFYIEVSAANTGLFDVGGYSLLTIFDDENQIDRATMDELAGGQFRFLSAEELARLFDSSADFYNDDAHTDDEFPNAMELETVAGFVEGTRYEILGSITDATDADYYVVKSPRASAGPLSVMTIAIRALETGGLVPRIKVLDEDSTEIPTTVLANGGGETIVQLTGVNPDGDYFVQVTALDPGGLFDTGNYSLIATFGSQSTTFDSLNLDPWPTVGNGAAQRIHTFYVGKPQLFHFVIDAGQVAVNTPTAVVATIYDDQGNQIYRFSTLPGETRSREAVLLEPGTYTTQVVALTFDGSPAPEISYNIRWVAISDPFVGDPNDPTANPFACSDPDLAGFFCYPGDFHSTDPVLWEEFVNTLTEPPAPGDPIDTLSSLFNDWWTWVWNDFGENGPVFANNDTYHGGEEVPLVVSNIAPTVRTLSVGGAQGVLKNDVDPENLAFVAQLKDDVSHGTLDFQPDGSFVYTPDSGFRGMDQFTYEAFDFFQLSNVGTVKIVIGDSGDFDASGNVDGRDFLAWQRGYGTTGTAALGDGDANLDFAVDATDLHIWNSQYPGPVITVNGDTDGDGLVDGRDFLTWQRGFGDSGNASREQGDVNGDGDVNSADLTIWQSSYGTGNTAVFIAAAPLLSNSSTMLLALQVSVQDAATRETTLSRRTTALFAPVERTEFFDQAVAQRLGGQKLSSQLAMSVGPTQSLEYDFDRALEQLAEEIAGPLL